MGMRSRPKIGLPSWTSSTRISSGRRSIGPSTGSLLKRNWTMLRHPPRAVPGRLRKNKGDSPGARLFAAVRKPFVAIPAVAVPAFFAQHVGGIDHLVLILGL